jgi:hypothetical protein
LIIPVASPDARRDYRRRGAEYLDFRNAPADSRLHGADGLPCIW